MVKKIQGVQIAADLPPVLVEEFSAMAAQAGWVRKRAVAAALWAFVSLPESIRQKAYGEVYAAYRPTKDEPQRSQESDRVRADFSLRVVAGSLSEQSEAARGVQEEVEGEIQRQQRDAAAPARRRAKRKSAQ